MASKMSEPSDSPVKVLLWCTPRTMSTTFLKCMTFSCADTIAWYEPWHQVGKFGRDKDSPIAAIVGNLVEKMGGKAAVDKIKGGFDASNTTYEWLKNQLEGEFPGKKLVFVKEIAMCALRSKDTIPQGFRHTFLIRNPIKFAPSFLKAVENDRPFNRENLCLDKVRPYKATYDLLQHVKENYESNPVIVDTDDLLGNPSGMLEAYCKAVQIPYSDDLLHWEAGDDVMTKHWMVAKETILIFRAMGNHESTFSSTGFQKPNGQPVPQATELSPVLKQLVDDEMPYYEKMYAERLKC